MKVIYVGPLTMGPDRDSSWIASFKQLGCQVIPFSSELTHSGHGVLAAVWGKLQRRLNAGKRNSELQKRLISLAERENPDWVHFRLPLAFDRTTIEHLKSRGIVVTQYCNDDPFSRKAPLGLFWKFRHALSAYDGHFVWRERDLATYRKAGAKYVEHSPPYYDPAKVIRTGGFRDRKGFRADAAFVGHWENDWRVDCLDALLANQLSVILKGGGWDRAIRGRRTEALAPVTHAFGEDYYRIYANVVAGVCFFSKINNDEWTRRALEIVAVGGLLVCERTGEAAHHFTDREEAFFFSSIEELVAIVAELKRDPLKRERVRAAGYARLLRGDETILRRATSVYEFARKAAASSRDRERHGEGMQFNPSVN